LASKIRVEGIFVNSQQVACQTTFLKQGDLLQPVIQHTAARRNRLLGQNTIVRPFPFENTGRLSIWNGGVVVEENVIVDDFSQLTTRQPLYLAARACVH
jgi:hypothetical protein